MTLTLKSIKVKSIDDKSPYFFPTRSIEIRTSDHRFLTPYRASTTYEFNQRTEIPHISGIENPVSLSVKRMNTKKIKDFLQLNGSYKNLSKKILNDDDLLKYSSIRSHIIQPTISAQYKKDKKTGKMNKIISGVDYLEQNKSLREQFLKFVIKIQMDAKLETISIPYLKQPLSEYKKMAKTVSERLKNEKREPLFVVDLGIPERNSFTTLIRYLTKDLRIRLIAFPHKSFSSAAISYDALSQLAEQNTAFLNFDFIRADPHHFDLSKMHYSPFIGTDIFSIRTPQFIPDPDEPKKERTKESVKFFNQSNLQIESSKQRMKDPDLVLSEMGESKDKKLREIFGSYEKVNHDEEYIKTLSAVSKVHELKSSTQEFLTLQKRIKSSESTEYVTEHSSLSKTLDSLQSKKSQT